MGIYCMTILVFIKIHNAHYNSHRLIYLKKAATIMTVLMVINSFNDYLSNHFLRWSHGKEKDIFKIRKGSSVIARSANQAWA